MKTYDELKALIDSRGVHPVFGGAGDFDWGIEQQSDELAHFLVHMQQLGVESVLEIGTGWKAGLARFLHDDMGWAVTSVDIHDYGHEFGGIVFLSLEQARAGLNYKEGYPQLVIIDGDHAYEAVKADHAEWGSKATQVIAFHDTVGLRDCEGVQQYWDEVAFDALSNLKPGHYELLALDEATRGGIGYIVLSEVLDAPAEAEPAETPKPKAPRKPAAKKTAKKQ